jgi:hypothetical protein
VKCPCCGVAIAVPPIYFVNLPDGTRYEPVDCDNCGSRLVIEIHLMAVSAKP